MIELTLTEALAVGGALLALTGWIWTVKNKTDHNETKIRRLFQFKDEHERDSNDWRNQYSREMAEVQGMIKSLDAVSIEQFKSLGQQIRHLENTMTAQLERLDSKMERMREDSE